MNKMRLLLAMGLLSFAACGDDSLSEEDSQKGFMAVQQVLQVGSASAQSSVAQGLVSINFTYNCPAGGSAAFVGAIDDVSNSTSTEATFNYTVTFTSCKAQGVTLDGAIDYSFDVSATETSSSLEYSYVGNVNFSGEVDGDCDLDVHAKINTNSSDTSATISYEYYGNLCDNDADSLNASGTFSIDIPQD